MKTSKIIIWILRILLAGLFVLAGYSKLAHGPGEEAHLIAIYKQLGNDIMLAASMCELGGALALLVPAVSFYANILLLIVMIIAVGVSIIVGGIGSAVFPMVVLVVLSVLLYLQQKEIPTS
jgi:uncharacterized membrane protein YphA (DoxX/SURF4 family)